MNIAKDDILKRAERIWARWQAEEFDVDFVLAHKQEVTVTPVLSTYTSKGVKVDKHGKPESRDLAEWEKKYQGIWDRNQELEELVHRIKEEKDGQRAMDIANSWKSNTQESKVEDDDEGEKDK